MYVLFTEVKTWKKQSIASTQVAIKGIVQYSVRAQFLVEQLATRRSREHTLSTVSPDAQVE